MYVRVQFETWLNAADDPTTIHSLSRYRFINDDTRELLRTHNMIRPNKEDEKMKKKKKKKKTVTFCCIG